MSVMARTRLPGSEKHRQVENRSVRLWSVMAIERDEVATFAPALRPDIGRLEDLYASSQRRLVIQMAALTGDIAAAEDLVQEAFGRCVAKWAQVAGYDDPEAWVRSVAYNLARSRWRRLEEGGESAQPSSPRRRSVQTRHMTTSDS